MCQIYCMAQDLCINTKTFANLKSTRKIAAWRTRLVIWCKSVHWANKRNPSYGFRWRNIIGLATASQPVQSSLCTWSLRNPELAGGLHLSTLISSESKMRIESPSKPMKRLRSCQKQVLNSANNLVGVFKTRFNVGSLQTDFRWS